MLVIDNDDDVQDNSNEFVDSFAINMNSNLQVGASLIRDNVQGTYQWATMTLTARLLCAEHYYGERCENYDACSALNITCSGRGPCIDGVATYTCHCNEGFTGLMCQTNIDDCVGVNCSGNGQCVDGVNNFTCLCQSGFTGVLCSKNVQDMKLAIFGLQCSHKSTCTYQNSLRKCETQYSVIKNTIIIIMLTYIYYRGIHPLNTHVLEQSSGSSAGGIAGGVIGVLVAVILIMLLIILIVVLAMKGRKESHLTDTQGRSSTLHYKTSCKDNTLSTTQHARGFHRK